MVIIDFGLQITEIILNDLIVEVSNLIVVSFSHEPCAAKSVPLGPILQSQNRYRIWKWKFYT